MKDKVTKTKYITKDSKISHLNSVILGQASKIYLIEDEIKQLRDAHGVQSLLLAQYKSKHGAIDTQLDLLNGAIGEVK